MAGQELATSTNDGLPATARARSSIRALPAGPCHFHDAAFGTSCGCKQFWDKRSEDTVLHRPLSERSTWCVCGHHACFHALETRAAPSRHELSGADARSCTQPRADERGQIQAGSPSNFRLGVRSIGEEIPPLEKGQPAYNTRWKTSPAESNQLILRQAAAQTNRPGLNDEARNSLSQTSSSGLPPVPSMCLLSQDKRPAANREATDHVSPSRQAVAGLGIGMGFDNVGNALDGPQSLISTVPDTVDMAIPPNAPRNEPSIPSLGILDQFLQLDHNNLLQDTYDPNEFAGSVTERATPTNTSYANTPDLRPADQAVQDAAIVIDNLIRIASSQQRSSPGAGPSNTTTPPAQQLLLTNALATVHEHLEQAFRSASPAMVQELISFLKPIYNLLISMPNMTSAVRELNGRVDTLENRENNSFNQAEFSALYRRCDMLEGRVLEGEQRWEDHDKLHQTIDADHSTSSFPRHRLGHVSESFGSNNSGHSVTSSALIVAAMDRNELETELVGLKERLDHLESAALPTSVHPWNIEVVLLPWGRELRGIWFSADEPMHDPTRGTTQDSEVWTQVRSRSGKQSDTESGWNSQTISEWAAEPTDEWLSAKACGEKLNSFQRLRSRGFVRDVNLTSANARDIQTTLAYAFRDLAEHLKTTEYEDNPTIRTYAGLRASFVPLRKVHKDPKLRFLTPSEMHSSALWSAQFLASGITMRLSGGKKRLYVTQREAYMQPSEHKGLSWQDLRALPRYQPDPDTLMNGNDEQCQPQDAETDAEEECWALHPTYDIPPPSVTSSFNSQHSAQLSMRPANRNLRRSTTPSSILKNRVPQPISPLSENQPQRPRQGRNRTVSAPLIEPAPQSSAKRRFNANASPVKVPSAPSASRQKRRRVASSSSPQPGHSEADTGIPIWANTPRRSREPQSPGFSHPELPRTNSDVASRIGKGTPSAYATPHSAPFVIGVGSGGDTVHDSDSDNYQDDSEQSWPGVMDDEESSGASDVELGTEELTFSAIANKFGSDEDADTGEDDDDDDEGEDGDDDENDDDDEGDDESGYGALRS